MKKGFSFIELMVVISVIGVLSITGFTSYRRSQLRSYDAKRRADLEVIRNGLELYKVDNGVYPAVTTGNAQTYLLPALSSPVPYVTSRNFPNDPLNSNGNYYYYGRVGTTAYYLCALMDVPSLVASNEDCGSVSADCNATNGTASDCNYGVTQP